MHPCAEIGHQVAERAGFPAFIECLEAFGHAISGRGDLVRINSVELAPVPGSGDFWIPEDERPAANLIHRGSLPARFAGNGQWERRHRSCRVFTWEDGVTRLC